MKKIFNDHIGLWLILTLAIAGTATFLAVDNRKAIKRHEDQFSLLKKPVNDENKEQATE